MTSSAWRAALAHSAILDALARFDPRVAGTLPLGLGVAGSDVDVLCHAPDARAFAAAVWDACRERPGFAIHQWRRRPRPVISRFTLGDVPFEVFGSPEPVDKQPGWRHFVVERRLLGLGGPPLREAVMAARRAGDKTEAAFARVLGLAGDPYAAMLDIGEWTDEALAVLVRPLRASDDPSIAGHGST